MDLRILVVDDEEAISEIIKFNFKREGFIVETLSNGRDAIKFLKEKKDDYSLVLLDIMMPGIDGFETLKEIRKFSNIPVIMLTAREEEFDKVLGLELGADDYVVKPFSMRELIARVKAVFRRFDIKKEEEKRSEIIKIDDLLIDLNKYEVTKNGKKIELTLREFELLEFLARSPGEVFSREELLEKVWEYEYYGDIRTVDVTIRRLREKIEETSKDNKEFKYILTKRGIGYYFKEQDGK